MGLQLPSQCHFSSKRLNLQVHTYRMIVKKKWICSIQPPLKLISDKINKFLNHQEIQKIDYLDVQRRLILSGLVQT